MWERKIRTSRRFQWVENFRNHPLVFFAWQCIMFRLNSNGTWLEHPSLDWIVPWFLGRFGQDKLDLPTQRLRRGAEWDLPWFVAEFARIHWILNSCEFCYGKYFSAARLKAIGTIDWLNYCCSYRGFQWFRSPHHLAGGSKAIDLSGIFSLMIGL